MSEQRKTTSFLRALNNSKKPIIIILYGLGSAIFLFSIYYDVLKGNSFDIGTKQTPLLLIGIVFIVLGFLGEKKALLTDNFQNIFRKRSKEGTLTSNLFRLRFVLLISIVLFLVFFIFYLFTSLELSKTGLFSEHDALFELDIRRVMMDMASARSAHDRTHVHPLYVLIVNPFGSILIALFKHRLISSVIVNSILGALGVQLSFFMMWLLTKDLCKSTLLAGLFGFSTSQFFLSVMPDTASLAVCSLAATFLLFFNSLTNKRITGAAWLLAGLFTLGVTITNFAQTMICYSILVFSFGFNKHSLLKIVRYFFSVLFFAIILALIQKHFYPSSVLFFLPEAYQEEIGYLNRLLLSNPFGLITQVFKSFLLDNVVAPIPVVFYGTNTLLPYLTFTGAFAYLPFGYFALVLWVPLLILGILHITKSRQNRLFITGVIICWVFNFILHLFYGASHLQPDHFELFLYSGNVTILVMMVVASYFGSETKRWLLVAVSVLLLFLSVNNYLILYRIIGLYFHR